MRALVFRPVAASLAFAAGAVLSTSLPGPARARDAEAVLLERSTAPAPRSANADCEISYHDLCGGALLFGLEEWQQVLGVVFDACAADAELTGAWIYNHDDWPAGWGYTGYIAVNAVRDDNSLIQPPIRRDPYLTSAGWSFHAFHAPVPARFAVTIEYWGGVLGGHRPTFDNAYQDPCIPYRPVPHSGA